MMESVFRDVALEERLAFQNVVSSRGRFQFSEMAQQFAAFVERVSATGCEPKGPLFYSLNNIPMDEIVDVEFFLPIQQGRFPPTAGLTFHSYFEVSPLLRGVVVRDFENQTERVYAELLATLERNGREINSPFYHLIQRDVPPRALVYVGYANAVTATSKEHTS